MRSPALLLVPLLTACPKARSPTPDHLLAALADERGRVVGTVRAAPGAQGVSVSARLYALPQGRTFNLAIHQGDGCGGHTFTDAGPAWSPPGASGPTLFGPVKADDRGRAALNATDPALTLSGIANGLRGRPVLLVPADPDPASDGLPRACGVLADPPEQEVQVGGDQPDLTEAWEF